MRTKNNVLVFDTETVGTFGKPLIHDWAWSIKDKLFNNLVSRRYLVAEFHEDQTWVLRASEFYRTKHELYKEAIATEEVEVKTWNEIVKIFLDDLKTYGVKCLSAYNIAFDYKALKYTDRFFNRGSDKLMKAVDKRSLLCIWNLACDTILCDHPYHEFCEMKNFISDSGNYFTNAQSCYAYLTNNAEYEEEHTALADVEIEAEILKYILTNCKGNVEYGLAYNCWRKAQK